jgi:hypothetical protein
MIYLLPAAPRLLDSGVSLHGLAVAAFSELFQNSKQQPQQKMHLCQVAETTKSPSRLAQKMTVPANLQWKAHFVPNTVLPLPMSQMMCLCYCKTAAEDPILQFSNTPRAAHSHARV